MQLDAHDLSALQAASEAPSPRASRVFVSRPRGFTMVEMLVVVVILVILAGIVLLNVNSTQENSQATIAQSNIVNVRDAVMGGPGGPGFYSDMRSVDGYDFDVDFRVEDLFQRPNQHGTATPVDLYDRVKHKGWRGPYLTLTTSFTFPDLNVTAPNEALTWTQRNFISDYGTTGAITLPDPWNAPFVFQNPPVAAGEPSQARLVCAGANGVIDTPPGLFDYQIQYQNTNPTKPKYSDDIVIFLFKADERVRVNP